MYLDYRDEKDFIGMDMCRKFLEMGFTRREDMRITTQEESIRRVREIYYYRKKTTQRVNMLNPQQFSREYEILWRETIYMLK